MRIISKFHDYYDGVQNFGGSDQSIVYVRETSKVDYEKINSIDENDFYVWHDTYIFRNLITVKLVGFCGKIYPTFHYSITSEKWPYNTKDYYFYENVLNLDDISQYLQTKVKNVNLNRFLKWYNNHIQKDYSGLNHIFTKYNTPCFIYHSIRGAYKDKLTLHPNLGEIQFYKVFDSYSAFQEIEMYLNNVLVGDLTPTQITDDKVLLLSKGFGNQSFKQVSPGARKARREKFKRRNK